MGIVRLAQSSPPSKTTFKRLLVILQNLVHIEYDNENYGYDDFNGNNGGDYDGPNDPKPDKYHGMFCVKEITNMRYAFLTTENYKT